MKVLGVIIVLGTGLLTERFAESGWLGWHLYAVCIALGVLCVCSKDGRGDG